MKPTYKDVPNCDSVAVIVISHNYGCFLDQCIDSLRNQSIVPFECVVIADNCDVSDITVSVAQNHNLRCLVVDNRNVHANRRLGLEYTRAPNVIFLDADDYLHPAYISQCLSVLQNNKHIGIVSTHLDRGDYVLYHQERNINHSNYLHAGSMVRRTCLVGCEAFVDYSGNDVNLVNQCHADWFLWRSVIRNGWRAHIIEKPLYYYREHSASMLKSVMQKSYYEYASLINEKVTVVIPLCRERYWPHLRQWLSDNSGQFTDLMIIDSSNIKNDVGRFLSNLDKNVTHIKRPNNNLADIHRQNNKLAYLDVQNTMLRVYSPLYTIQNEYIMVIEDDVLPPDGAIRTLLQSMGSKVAGISGLVRSRYCDQQRPIAGNDFNSVGGEILTNTGQKITEVGYTGFGCLLLRRSVLHEMKPLVTGHFDMEFCKDVQASGYKWLLDWTVDCRHGYISIANES